MKKPFVQRMGDFLEGKGFYIVLLLCVAAIGLSCYYLLASFTGTGEDTPVGGQAQITVTPTPVIPSAPSAVSTPRVTATPAPQSTQTAVQATATPEPTATPQATPQAAPTVWLWPVRGQVLTGHSVETLAYDPTMGDWRTHTGVDIAASAGTQVRAAAAGTVTAVEEDVMLGTAVTVDHGGGMYGLYANLASVPTVEVGDEVSAGDVLGSVGNTAIAESALPDHLHFSLTADGQAVDPLSYLTE